MIHYNEDWFVSVVFHLRGSVCPRAALFAFPGAFFTVALLFVEDYFPAFRFYLGYEYLDKSYVWSATSGALSILLGLRSNRALARFWEGTGLLHMMRGEWFDSVSCCVTFTTNALPSKKAEVMNFRHSLVRLMSICHGGALEEIAKGGDSLSTIDAMGLDNNTLDHLQKCEHVYKFNRVEVVLHMIQTLITQSLADDILKIPPPILSRVYQTVSRGFVNFLNAKKIADHPFPLPFAQLIAVFLFFNLFSTPVFVAAVIRNKIIAFIITFVYLFGIFGVNFIAGELENPYGLDDNDLPLCRFQDDMNQCLLLLLEDDADLVPGISNERCEMDFAALLDKMDQGAQTTSRVAYFGTQEKVAARRQFFRMESCLSSIPRSEPSIGDTFAATDNAVGIPQHPRQKHDASPQKDVSNSVNSGAFLSDGISHSHPSTEKEADAVSPSSVVCSPCAGVFVCSSTQDNDALCVRHLSLENTNDGASDSDVSRCVFREELQTNGDTAQSQGACSNSFSSKNNGTESPCLLDASCPSLRAVARSPTPETHGGGIDERKLPHVARPCFKGKPKGPGFNFESTRPCFNGKPKGPGFNFESNLRSSQKVEVL
eukprot:TRINITY_DN13320_c0_g5_i1.p1 TRINITY_DN13320_c0_g5~~TRINITY_DN13320_c0_g5_i1.p1  ORF type:complete len:611 (+),score=84.28 TRINITY_DN13320_c0_g5_i1:38-1834(+)